MAVMVKDFIKDILRLRDKGMSYEKIAFWLAENKGLSVTPQGVRAAYMSYQRSIVKIESKVKK